MTPTSSNILLEKLTFEENSDLAWDDRLFKIHSIINNTKDIVDATKVQYPLPDNYVIKRKRIIQTTLSILAASAFTFTFGYILLTKFSTGAAIVSFILLPSLYYVLYKNLTSKEINFEIHLSKKGILIMDNFYPWSDIQETYFVYRPKGKNYTKHFVLGLKNGVLDRYIMDNLLEFNLSERTFSALIEEYRHQ